LSDNAGQALRQTLVCRQSLEGLVKEAQDPPEIGLDRHVRVRQMIALCVEAMSILFVVLVASTLTFSLTCLLSGPRLRRLAAVMKHRANGTSSPSTVMFTSSDVPFQSAGADPAAVPTSTATAASFMIQKGKPQS